MLKIVYCSGNICNSGGMERVLSTKTNYLVNQGYDVSIITLDKKNEEKPFFYFDPRIKIYHLCLDLKAKNLFQKMMNKSRICKRLLPPLEVLLRDIKPDIAISMFGKQDRYLFKCEDGSKKIVELHFSKYKRSQYFAQLDKSVIGRMYVRLFRRKEYAIMKHFDKFIVLTEEDKEAWGPLPNIRAIPNPLTFYPKEVSDCTAKCVIAVGRFVRQKQFNFLIDSYNLVTSKYPDWKLTLYGSGPLESDLRAQIKQLKLEDRVKLLPPTTDVEGALLSSSIYALSSLYEGLPVVLLEAMSCGLPAVSFACKCGPRDVITDGEDGFLVAPKDVKALAEKLDLLMGDESLRKRMGESARKNIIRYSEDAVMQQWIDLFDELVKK